MIILTQRCKIAVFIAIEFGLVILSTLPLFILHAEPTSLLMIFISIIFMVLPALATLIVRRLAHERSRLFLQLNFRKSWKEYLLAAFLPGILEAIGVVTYFVIFPSQFDLSLSYVSQLLAANGQFVELPQLSLPVVIGIGLILILAAPLVLVNHVAAFGEEIGWRGFLLPLLLKEFGMRKAVLLNGVLWGIAHAPLVCFGLNYTGDYPGKPWSGILIMIVFATSIEVFLSYLTLKSRSIFPACIAHGTINAIREAPLLICLDNYNALLGPKPSGLIGMIGFLVLFVILMFCGCLEKAARTARTDGICLR